MSDIMERGIDLVIYGMGTVFVFLSILILVILVMSSLVKRFEATALPVSEIDPRILAAIKSAVHRYRDNHRPGV
jgi:oxaloacetate decarboxylase (Na+ extruding) subunit gamma